MKHCKHQPLQPRAAALVWSRMGNRSRAKKLSHGSASHEWAALLVCALHPPGFDISGLPTVPIFRGSMPQSGVRHLFFARQILLLRPGLAGGSIYCTRPRPSSPYSCSSSLARLPLTPFPPRPCLPLPGPVRCWSQRHATPFLNRLLPVHLHSTFSLGTPPLPVEASLLRCSGYRRLLPSPVTQSPASPCVCQCRQPLLRLQPSACLRWPPPPRTWTPQ